MSGVEETQGEYDVLLQLDNSFNFVKLGEVSRVIMGQAPPSSTCSEKPVGMPFLQGNAEFGARHPISKQYCSITPRQAEIGDILISVRAPVGEVNVADQPYVIGRGLAAIHPTKNDQNFAWHSIRFFAPELEKVAQGSTFTAIGRQELESVEIPTFGESADRRIAAVLDTLDAAIEKSEALIAKLKQVRAGMLHDLLTCGADENGEISDRDSLKLQTSAIGEIPSHWQSGSLNDLVFPNRPIVYGILMPGHGFPNGVPVIKVKDIRDRIISTDDLLLTDPKIDEAYRRSRVRTGDLLFTIRGTVGRMAFVQDELGGANITQDTARISFSEKANPIFISHWLESDKIKRFIQIHTLGVAVQGINLGDVRRIPVAIPPRSEQDRIAEIIQSAERLIFEEVKQGSLLRNIRVGLSADLLTGQVRVPPDLELP